MPSKAYFDSHHPTETELEHLRHMMSLSWSRLDAQDGMLSSFDQNLFAAQLGETVPEEVTTPKAKQRKKVQR
jgi:hypothetical protein